MKVWYRNQLCCVYTNGQLFSAREIHPFHSIWRPQIGWRIMVNLSLFNSKLYSLISKNILGALFGQISIDTCGLYQLRHIIWSILSGSLKSARICNNQCNYHSSIIPPCKHSCNLYIWKWVQITNKKEKHTG